MRRPAQLPLFPRPTRTADEKAAEAEHQAERLAALATVQQRRGLRYRARVAAVITADELHALDTRRAKLPPTSEYTADFWRREAGRRQIHLDDDTRAEPDTLAPPTLESVRQLYPNIRQAPHPYFDLRNRTGTSPFPPGLPAPFYQPFVAHFNERAQTAAAQARRFARKHQAAAADEWTRYANDWREAERVALMRLQRAVAAEPYAPDRQLQENHAYA